MSFIGPRTSRNGFTIVELLIVIVVIAILAAISIVAYNGVQIRAESTKTVKAIEAYKKALLLYKTDNGVYPAIGAMCLGDQYAVFTGGATPACRYSTSQIAVTNNTAARNSLRVYMNNALPMPSVDFLHDGTGREYVGAHFYGSSYSYKLDGNPVITIEYYIKSDTCPVGPVYASTPPNFVSPSVSRSEALSDGSRCFLLLPDS